MRNLRKLKVNADVTFAIWILEWVGTFIIIFFWCLDASRGINLIMEAVIVIFYVVLPHSYLMNTAHNKDRIIDEGLKNIIKNALYMPFNVKSIMISLGLVMNEIFRENGQDPVDLNKDKNKSHDTLCVLKRES